MEPFLCDKKTAVTVAQLCLLHNKRHKDAVAAVKTGQRHGQKTTGPVTENDDNDFLKYAPSSCV